MNNCRLCNKPIGDNESVCSGYCGSIMDNTKANRKEQYMKYCTVIGLKEPTEEELMEHIMDKNVNDYVFQDYLDDFRAEAKRVIKNKQSTKKKESIYDTLVNMKAWEMLRDMINKLQRDTETREYAKMLKLEIEEHRKLSLGRLKFKIETLTGRPASGTYTLQEIGNIYGVSRERIRQIEHRVFGSYDSKKGRHIGGMFTSPHSARKIRDYIYN